MSTVQLRQLQRRIAIVMLLAWVGVLVAGTASACLLESTHGHAPAQSHWHDEHVDATPSGAPSVQLESDTTEPRDHNAPPCLDACEASWQAVPMAQQGFEAAPASWTHGWRVPVDPGVSSRLPPGAHAALAAAVLVAARPAPPLRYRYSRLAL